MEASGWHRIRAPRNGFSSGDLGNTVYSFPNRLTMPISHGNFGADGIVLSADGATLFFSAVGTCCLYSVPTARLLDANLTSELMATQAVVSHGQKGISDDLETDSNGSSMAQTRKIIRSSF